MHKPLIISEFGAGAKAGLHKDADYRFSEEYQANVFPAAIPDVQEHPVPRGYNSVGADGFPFADAAAPRHPGTTTIARA